MWNVSLTQVQTHCLTNFSFKIGFCNLVEFSITIIVHKSTFLTP
jgi:hypothetical protein